MPDGLSMSPGGVISGTPTTTGTFTGTITAANGTTPDATQAFSIVITQAPAITSAAPPGAGVVGTPTTTPLPPPVPRPSPSPPRACPTDSP
ncbi:MAG: putative Ig domain-containing protein [Kiritimatiellia bacterium]